jgi:uncharacterized repeat protein (TIGR01451 family)
MPDNGGTPSARGPARHAGRVMRLTMVATLVLGTVAVVAAPEPTAEAAQAGGTYTIGAGSVPSTTFPSGLTASATFTNGAAGSIDTRTSFTMATAAGTPASSFSPNVGGQPGFQAPLRRNSPTVDTTFVNVGTMTINFSRPVRNPALHLQTIAITNGASGSDAVTTETRFTLTTPGVTFTNRTIPTSVFSFTPTVITPGVSPTLSVNPIGSVELTGVASSFTISLDVRYRRNGGTAGGPINPFNFQASVTVDEDCSNAPVSYGNASHVISDAFLGASATADSTTALSTTPCQNTSDVNDANPTFAPLLTGSRGQAYSVPVSITVGNSSAATLAGWIDFNGDGDFGDAGEAATTLSIPQGTTATGPLNWTIPTGTGIVAGASWARFRIGHDAAKTSVPTCAGGAGMADSGEVEDYPITITGTTADVGVTKTGPTSAQVGDTVTFTVTATNGVPPSDPPTDAAANGVVLTDTLPAEFTNVTWTCAGVGGGVCNEPSGSGNAITATSNLPVSASAVYTITAALSSQPDGNTFTNVATVAAPAGVVDPNPANDTAQVSGDSPSLQFAKTVDNTAPRSGETVTYTVTVENTGTVPYTNATFSDDLADVVDDATIGTITASTGTATFDAPTQTLNWVGTVSAAATATVTYQVTIGNPPPGNQSMVNAVSSTAGGSNCLPGTTTAPCSTTVAIAHLTIAKSVSPTTAKPGGVVGFAISITNDGTADYTGLVLDDDLNDVFDDASFNDDQSDGGAGGAFTVIEPFSVGWTGSIPAGATVTLTYSVTVDNPPGGNLALSNTVSTPSPGTNCGVGSADAACRASTGIAQLAMTKTVDNLTPKVGETVTYTITLSNPGTADYTGATVTDNLADVVDDATFDNDQTDNGAGGAFTVALPSLSWTGTVPAGGGLVTLSYSVTVNDPPAGNKNLANAIVGPADSNCPAGNTDPACRTTGTGIPQLAIAKSASDATPKLGEVVTYTITLTNAGTAEYAGASIADDLTDVVDDATFNNDQSDGGAGGAFTVALPSLSWTGIVPAGGTVRITYTATVNDPPAGNQVLANGVVGPPDSNCPPGNTEPACGTTGDGIPQLAILKAVDNAQPKVGDDVTYTITLTNAGTADYVGASITDDLSDVVDDATFNNDAVATADTPIFSSPTLSWTGTVPAGGVVTITYTVTVNDPPTGNKNLANSIVGPPDSNCPPGNTDPACGTTGGGIPQLAIAKTVDNATPKPLDTVTYTISLTNPGTADYTGATVTDDLTDVIDDATFNGDQTATAGTVTFASPTLTWSGTVPTGGSVTISYSATVNNPPGGNLQLGNAVTGPTDSNCAPGSTDPACGGVPPNGGIPLLHLVKTIDPAGGLPGGTMTYTVTLTNPGTAAYVRATVTDDLTDVIDDATYNYDENDNGAGGSFTVALPSLTWTGDVPVGATVTITYSVTIDNPPGGNLILDNAVTSTPDTNCPPGNTSPDCSITPPAGIPALQIAKTISTAMPAAGDTVGYTITITNVGTGTYPAAVVTDDLTDVIDDATFNNDQTASSGSITFASPMLSWTGDVPVGTAVTITYSVSVDQPPAGNKTLANAVVGPQGSNCEPGGPPDSACAPAPAPIQSLTITKTVDNPTPKPTQTITYTVTLENTGGADIAGASFTDDLSDLIDDATYNNDQTATAGTVAFASPALSWSGDIAVGTVAAVTYSATVDDPPGGNLKLGNAVASDTPGSDCPPGSTDPACATGGGPDDGVAVLHVTHAAQPAQVGFGETATYTITMQNIGAGTYTGALLVDDLTDINDDGMYNGDAVVDVGSIANGSIEWSGDLGAGQTATVTFTATAGNPAAGNLVMTTRFIAQTVGTNCPAGSTDPSCHASVPIVAAVVAGAAEQPSSPSSLPFTGRAVVALLWAAIVLLVLGSVLGARRIRRRASPK